MMTDAAFHTLIALLLHALSFLVLALVIPFRRRGRPAAWFSILCAGGSLVAAVIAWNHGAGSVSRVVWTWLISEGQPLATVGILADGESTIMLVLVALISFLVQLYSIGYLSEEPPASLGRYFTYQALFAFSMMGVVIAPNLLQLFICWELVGLCSYLLIGYWYYKPEAARAAVKAFWTTKLGDTGFLIGIVLLWRLAGTFDLTEMQVLVESGALPVAGLSIITFCIYLGAMGKSAQFPLHVWLPDAMEGPTPVSALIHAATMVTLGVYLLLRLEWLFALTPDVLLIVAWIGAFTALLAAVLACVQDDIKRVLAYSTVSQLGYMMTAIGAGFATAGFFHLLTHGIFKGLLFLGAGAVIHAVHSNDLQHMGGLARRMPQTTIAFLVGTLSLAGIPLFGGFLSKEEILGAVWAAGLAGPFAVLMLVAFLTAFYMFRVVFLAFFGTGGLKASGYQATGSLGPSAVASAKAEAGSAASHSPGSVADHSHDVGDSRDHRHVPHDPPISMALPLWILAFLSVAVGLYFMVAGPALPFGTGEPEFEAPGWLMPSAVGVAIAGILLAWLTYQRRTIDAASLAGAFAPIRDAALRKFWLDDLFEALYGRVLLAFSRLIGWFDRYIVDGVLNVVSAWTLTSGDDLRTMQSGRAQDYVYGVAVGLVVLLIWVRLG